jgi:hypothetical protein
MLAADYRQSINRQLPIVERSCTSKARFLSRREAQAVARHGRHSTGQLAAYHCRYCQHWHLGHRRRPH